MFVYTLNNYSFENEFFHLIYIIRITVSTTRAFFFSFVYRFQSGGELFEEEVRNEDYLVTSLVSFVRRNRWCRIVRFHLAWHESNQIQSNLDFSSLKRHASIPNIYIMPGVAGIYLVAKLCASGRVVRFSRKMYESCELIEVVVVVGLVSPFVFFHF